MAVSEAKLEANRRNAMKSCGPRSEAGKQRSKLNAVKHGMRAATLVLLDEDAKALEDRRADWAASLMPRGAAEQRIVDDAVEYSWLRDRARRAQEARLATNIANAGVDDAIREADEVLRLGQKLFADNRGSLANYPHYDMEKDEHPECVPLVSQSDLLDDPEDPQRLVLHLQATAGGCQWMLDRWSELRSILEEGLDWQSADKLKAVRLLGRQPIEAVDDRSVLTIFVACQAIESQPIIPIPEIWNELREYERMPYAQRLIGRGIQKLSPKDAAAVRQALYAIIDHATAQIAAKAEVHRMRAEINDSLAVDRLAFDDSPEAERLRRFDLACGRGLARSLDSLLKLRRAPESNECPSSVISEPTSEGEAVESSATANATIEPTVACENVTNEPTDAYQRECKVLKTSRIKITSRIKNEDRRPTVGYEIVTNEPTVGCENLTNEPNDPCDIVTNEPAAASEPAAGFENTTIEPTADHENPTDEPTAQAQNLTIEPTLAALGEDTRGVVTTAVMNDRDESDLHEGIDRQFSDEWNHARIARVVALRAEKQRELNDEVCREAQAASAGRLSRFDWHKNRKPVDRRETRSAAAKPRPTAIDRARTVGASAELVGTGSGLTTLCRSGSPTNP